MSLRQVLTIYRMERELNADDMALLNTIRRFTDAERETLIEGLSSKPQKKSSKKSAGKSRRASEMATQLNKQLGERRSETAEEPISADAGCANCVYVFAHNVHHLPSVEGYHEFQPAEQAAGASGD